MNTSALHSEPDADEKHSPRVIRPPDGILETVQSGETDVC